MARVIQFAFLFAWAAIAMPDEAHAAPDSRTVEIGDVPGLAGYMTGRFQTGWRKKRDVFLVRLLDMDEKPDGVDEVLLSVDKFDAEYCTNSGCGHAVLVRQPDGSLKAVSSFRGFGLKIADTYTNGVRDLISETLKGNRRLNLAGLTSGTRDRGKPEPSFKDTRNAASGIIGS